MAEGTSLLTPREGTVQECGCLRDMSTFVVDDPVTNCDPYTQKPVNSSLHVSHTGDRLWEHTQDFRKTSHENMNTKSQFIKYLRTNQDSKNDTNKTEEWTSEETQTTK